MVCKKEEKTNGKKEYEGHAPPKLFFSEIQNKKSRLNLLLKWRENLANANQSSMISQFLTAGRTAF